MPDFRECAVTPRSLWPSLSPALSSCTRLLWDHGDHLSAAAGSAREGEDAPYIQPPLGSLAAHTRGHHLVEYLLRVAHSRHDLCPGAKIDCPRASDIDRRKILCGATLPIFVRTVEAYGSPDSLLGVTIPSSRSASRSSRTATSIS